MAQISPEIEEIIRKFIALIQKERTVLKVILYGSYAKGMAREWSDIDVAVISNDFSDDLFQERANLMKLASCVDERIEPNPFRPGDFNENDPMVSQINRSGAEIQIMPTNSALRAE